MDQKLAARRRSQRGFTMIEVMLVVVIIGIISSLAIPRIMTSAARARKTEAMGMVEKMRRHFINQYRNQGFYTAPATAGNCGGGPLPGASDWNPPDTPSQMGQPLPWNKNAVGWSDFTFPPDGALRLRYCYQTDGKDSFIINVKGNLPGLDSLYTYIETYSADALALDPAEYPEL